MKSGSGADAESASSSYFDSKKVRGGATACASAHRTRRPPLPHRGAAPGHGQELGAQLTESIIGWAFGAVAAGDEE